MPGQKQKYTFKWNKNTCWVSLYLSKSNSDPNILSLQAVNTTQVAEQWPHLSSELKGQDGVDEIKIHM